MIRRVAATLAGSAALAAAGLLVAAPLAQAEPAPTDGHDGDGISVLDDLTVLPVQACGTEASVPILSDVLGPTDAAPDPSCTVTHD